MSKWISKVLFFLFIAITTFFVANFAEASKVIDFLRDQKDEFIISDTHLIQSTTISNYHDGTNSYVLADPLYTEKFISYGSNNQINYQLNIGLYSLVTFKNKEAYNSIAFILDDVIIADMAAQKDEKNRPIIDAKINFTKPLIFDGKEFLFSTETFSFVLDSNVSIFIIDHDVLKIDSGFSEIESIELSYRIIDSNFGDPLVTLSNFDYTEENLVGPFSDSYNRNISPLVNQNIDLLKRIGLDDFMTHPDIYFNTTLMKKYNSYNIYYVQYIFIEILIFLPLTYFLFFHKHVMVKYKLNKQEKEERLKTFKESLSNKDKKE